MSLLRNLRAEVFAWRAMRDLESGQGIEIAVKDLDDLFRKGIESLRIGTEVSDAYTQVDAVYTGINIIGRNLASVPWDLFNGDTRLPETAPERKALNRLLTRPNASMRGNQLLFGTSVNMERTGDAFWLLDKGAERTDRLRPGEGLALPAGVTMLPPSKVEPRIEQATGKLLGWKYGTKDLQLDEVVRFGFWNPGNPHKGLAPLVAGKQAIGLLWKASRWQELFYQNGGVPAFYIKLPPGVSLGGPDRKRIKERFKEQYLGLQNAGAVPIMQKGAELASVAVNQRDSEWAASVEIMTVVILALLGVPPAVAGFQQRGSKAESSSREQKRYFWHHTLATKADLIQSVINADIVERFLGEQYLFKFNLRAKLAEVIPEDVQEGINAAGKLWAMGVKATQAFEVVGLTVDTASQPALDVSWVPTSVQLAEFAMEKPEPPPAPDPPANPANTDDGDAAGAGGGEGSKGDGPPDPEQDAVVRDFAALARLTIDRDLDRLERQMLGEVRQWLLWLQGDVLKRLDTHSDRITLAAQQPHGGADMYVPPLEGKASQVDLLMPDALLYTERIVSFTEPARQATVQAGWTAVISEANVVGTFSLLDPMVMQAIQTRQTWIKAASKTSWTRVRESIATGLANRESLKQIEGRVKDKITQAYAGQAKVIARTEVAGGYNLGRYWSMQRHGIKRHTWLSAQDEDVRESHSITGITRNVGDVFPNGLRHPLDPAGPAAEIVNCRCVVLPASERRTP